MPVSDWSFKYGANSEYRGADVPYQNRPDDLILYDYDIALADTSGDGNPYWSSIGGAHVNVIERRSDQDRGYDFGAILVGCYFHAGSVYDMRGMIQDETDGGFYYARIFQVTGGSLVAMIGSRRPFTNGLLNPFSQNTYAYTLRPFSTIATGLSENDPFYTWFEWEIVGLPRPTVKLQLKYGTSLSALTTKQICGRDFSLFPDPTPVITPTGQAVSADKYSIAVGESYSLATSVLEHTMFGAYNVIGSYTQTEPVRVHTYQVITPQTALSADLIIAEEWPYSDVTFNVQDYRNLTSFRNF